MTRKTADAIPSQLDALRVPIEQLRAYERNPRRGDVSMIVDSLRAHGQYRPLVVNERTSEVLAGNHTLLAARELGWREIACTFVDVDDDEAARIVLVDNRTSDLASYDDRSLAALLASLDDLDGTGYEQDDLSQLLDALDVPTFDDDDESEHERYEFGVFDREQLIDAAFAHFRSTGFPYRQLARFQSMIEINKLAALDDHALAHTNAGYAVADTYHPHRYAVRVDGRPRNALDVFADDRLFRIALEHIVTYSSSLTPAVVASICSLTRGAQAASNFRPGWALMQLRRFAPDHAVVLDTSTGFGGRLVGFLASASSMYVGIDPARETHDANKRMVDELCPSSKRVELICKPAEDVEHELLRDSCDFALTSPPYFCKEHYSDEETQSFKRYPHPEAWRDGFLQPMLALQYAALRDGAISLLNIADVTIDKQTVPLVDWALHCARDVGFDVIDVEQLPLARRFGPQDDEVAAEPVIVLRK